MFYVYILYSKSLNLYYKGFTTDISKRLEYHNAGKSTYTSKTDDWELVYFDKFETKREALIEEKRLKKLNKASIEKIISNYNSDK
jgi:putative endonuclease